MISLPTFRGVLSSFSPLSLAPALWVTDTGSDPSVWTDMSGNGRHAVQATGANQPSIVTNALNGRQVRRFDGINDFMDSADFYSSNMSFFVAAKTNSSSTTQQILSKFSGTEREYLLSFSSTNKFVLLKNADGNAGGSNQFIETTSSVGTNYNVLCAIKNEATGTLSVNGVTTSGSFATSGVFNGTLPFRIGSQTVGSGSEFFNGDIAEILVFPTALSNANRKRVERYLSGKYAIAF